MIRVSVTAVDVDPSGTRALEQRNQQVDLSKSVFMLQIKI